MDNGFVTDSNEERIIQEYLEGLNQNPPAKPGRKLMNGSALDVAERSKTYRQRKRHTGSRAKGGRDYAGISYEGLDTVVPTFIGLDGEGVANRYGLLAASDGSEVCNWDQGLSTRDCFRFLLDLSRRKADESKTHAPKVRFIWFGMDYDINMMLRDIPRRVLERLWKFGTARWYDDSNPGHYYCISWRPRKTFSISYKQKCPPRHDPKTGKSIRQDKVLASFTSNDVFGFCQEGFVKSAKGWHILAEGDERIALLDEMKAKRGNFSQLVETEAGRETIRRYNEIELEILAQMGWKIWETHEGLGLHLGSMHGAGATAKLLLDKYKIAEHINNKMPERVREHVLSGYFGGRIQLHRLGRFLWIYAYDLRSAYPWVASLLPSLKDCRWYHAETFNPNGWGIWHVRWNCSSIRLLPPEQRHMIYPFPFRTDKGRILWPQQGEGWYWTPEVVTALRHFRGMIEVLEGDCLYLPNADVKPFAFIEALYLERLRLKNPESYDIGEKVIKVGLSAIYGKAAEGGHKYGSEDAEVRQPKNQSYIYAGMITSTVRATMLDAAMRDPRNVIGFATDCIFSRVDLGLPESEGLGGWEGKKGHDGLFLQPGVYRVHLEDGKVVVHNRGFLPSEFDWERVDREWDSFPDNATRFTFPSRRFVGLGSALQNGQEGLGKWRTWQEGQRELSPINARQIPFPQYTDTPKERETYGVSTIVGMQSGTGISQAYSPDYEWQPEEDDYMDNIDLYSQPELYD